MITSNGQVPVATDDDGPVGPGRVTGKQLRELMADDAWLDDLIDSAQQGGVQLTGQGGFLPEMIKAVLERGLAAELTGHLGYEQGDPAGRGSPNSRNGSTSKTLSTISLYAGGVTVRDMQAHLARTLGTELSHDTISKITDAVQVKAWQSRPFDELYPIMYLDAIVVKVRDGHQVRNKSAHIAVGVDMDGVKPTRWDPGAPDRRPGRRAHGPHRNPAGRCPLPDHPPHRQEDPFPHLHGHAHRPTQNLGRPRD